MKKILLLLFILFAFSNLTAQSISITVDGINNKKAILFSLEGEKTYLIDSINTDNKNTFNYSFDRTKHHPGIYRLTLDKTKWIDFIYDGEEINIETDANNILDSMVFVGTDRNISNDINVRTRHSVSNESLRRVPTDNNELFYAFIKLNKAYKTKTELLNLILARYPKNDEFYYTTLEKVSQLQSEYLTFVKEINNQKPNSFIAKYIQTSQLPIIPLTHNRTLNRKPTLTPEEQLQYLKSHALDNVDFNDANLIYSDAFTNKTIEYLTYYRNPQIPKELLEKEFMKAVDTILNKAKVHDLVYQHIVEYLIDGFKKFGFDVLLDYIVENYVIKDDVCLDEKTEGLIKKRIDHAKYLRVGNVVPNIILPDSTGKPVELIKIDVDKVLIVFYTSWCPHCKTLLPQIKEKYNEIKEKGIEVFAVSLDTNKKDWLNFIKENALDWLNVSDLKGWDSKAVLDYYLYATPTMILIDNEKKIIGKPLTIEELIKLNELIQS